MTAEYRAAEPARIRAYRREQRLNLAKSWLIILIVAAFVLLTPLGWFLFNYLYFEPAQNPHP